jgi:hypothetical protein
MSQSYVEQVAEIRRMTLDPDVGGSTYHPHSATIMPVHYPPNPNQPEIWVAGGAPDSRTGRRYPTVSKVNPTQFTPEAIESNILRAHLESQRSGDATIAAGTWRISEADHPRVGETDLDVSDLWPNEDSAVRVARKRGEETVFGNQGAVEVHTKHSPSHPKYRKKRTRKVLRNRAPRDDD